MKTINSIAFENTKNERTYRVEIPVGAPLGESYDAIIEIALELLKIAQSQCKKQEPESPKIIEMTEQEFAKSLL